MLEAQPRRSTRCCTGGRLSHLVAAYGYWAVLLAVTIGCAGIPFPATVGTTLAYWLGNTGGIKIVESQQSSTCGDF